VNTKELISHPFRVTGEGEGSILGNLVDDLTDKIKSGLEISVKEIQDEKKNISDLTTTSLQAYEYYFAGREAAFRMYYHEAIENFEKAVTLDTTFVEAYDALARQYYSIGDNVKAIEIIEKVTSFSDKLTEEKLVGILALEAYLKHDWDLAIKYYKRLTALNPEDISTHISLGMIYYQKKMMYVEGISEFEKVLELDREGAMHYSTLTPEEKERKVSFTYNVLGWAYLRKGEYKKANQAFEKYVALLPDQAYPLNVLGEFHLIVGNYDQAIANLNQSLQIDPDYPLTYVLFGDTYFAKGMYGQALSSYEKYLALCVGEAKKAKACFSLGKFYYFEPDYKKAIQECQQVLNIYPELVEAHWILGLSWIKKEMLDQAEAEISTIQGLIEKNKTEEAKIYYYHLSGELLLKRGLHQKALENFTEAANIMSLGRAFFVNALGEAYFEIGELDKAIEKSEEVLKINPNFAQTHYLLGQVYQKKGNKRKAREHFQKFMEIWKDADENLPQFIEAKRRLEEL
jgi:tetratricopeptide (TPR) repeat protein